VCGRCEICNAAGATGTCTPAGAGTDPHADCASPTADAACQASCDGARNCLIPTTPCRLACEPTLATTSPSALPSASDQRRFGCSAAGRCEFVAQTISCTTHGCGTPEQCSTSCTTDFECNKGFHCVSGACLIAKALGVACTTDFDCQSQFCDPVSGSCRECFVNADCDYASYCTPAGHCDTPPDCSVKTCAADGFGGACLTGSCVAANAGECTSPAAPNFDSALCECRAGQGTPGCRHGDVCSSTDNKTARCVGVAGRPCFGDAACASGKCVAHVCAKAAAGVFCRGPADCLSGVCAATAASPAPVCN
jgi:hypothetical protein